jgi:hypothetical protein
LWREFFLPNGIGHKIRPPKHLITQHLEVMRLVVVNRDPQRAILGQQAANDLQPVAHQPQPDGMLQPVVVVREGATRVVGRVNENALHLARQLGLQRLERQQVVALDQAVVKNILVRHALPGVVAAGRVLQQNARLQPGALVFADPGEF